MRILAVLAHPKKDSTSGKLFYHAVQTLQQAGHSVDIIDLYDHAMRIPFFKVHEPNKPADSVFEDCPFYWENKDLFLAADRLLLVYPVWWYAVPGIMKAWFDLITNYAWQFKGGNHAVALHNIKRVLVINTADMSWWYRFFGTRNSATEMVRESCKFLSIPEFKAYEINRARSTTAAELLKHQAAINNRLLYWLTGC